MRRSDPTDLAVSKLVAGREKDWPFVAEMVSHGIVDAQEVGRRMESMQIANMAKIKAWLASR